MIILQTHNVKNQLSGEVDGKVEGKSKRWWINSVTVIVCENDHRRQDNETQSRKWSLIRQLSLSRNVDGARGSEVTIPSFRPIKDN